MTRIRRLYDKNHEVIWKGSGGYMIQPNYRASLDFFCRNGWNWEIWRSAKKKSLVNFLTFWNRPWNIPEKGSWILKRIKKEPVKRLDPEKGTKEETCEGSWLWLSLKGPIKIYLEALKSSTREGGKQINRHTHRRNLWLIVWISLGSHSLKTMTFISITEEWGQLSVCR